MDDPGTLVVGASQAGLQIAASLRELGYTAPITLVGAEPHPPYQRPPLSKELLLDGVTAESLTLRTPAWYADAGIELVLGERVRELTMHGTEGAGTARTDNGRELRFSRLALATGARNRRLDLPGAELASIFSLRELDDAVALHEGLARARRVVIVGGGFIGLEIAAAARAAGAEVTVVEAAERLISRAVAPVVSEFYRAAHARRGTTVLLQTGVDGFEDDGARRGERRPPRGRARAARRPRRRRGRRHPQHPPRRADRPRVPARRHRRRRVRPHHPPRASWPRATAPCSPTRSAAATPCTWSRCPTPSPRASPPRRRCVGRPEPVTAVPWFWSYQGDLKLQIAGLSYGYDQLVVRGDPDSEKFSVLYYADGRLLAVDAINNPARLHARAQARSAPAGSIPADAADRRDASRSSSWWPRRPEPGPPGPRARTPQMTKDSSDSGANISSGVTRREDSPCSWW